MEEHSSFPNFKQGCKVTARKGQSDSFNEWRGIKKERTGEKGSRSGTGLGKRQKMRDGRRVWGTFTSS